MHFIKNIIFDLGGVIINLDMSATEQAFYELFGEQAHELNSTRAHENIFHPFEKGEISETQFRNLIREITGMNVTDEEIDYAWNAMLGEIPKERLDFLTELKSKYRTFLLSNTNTIHYKAFNKILDDAHGFPELEPFFEKCYYSQEVAMRKPNADIFEHVLNQNKLVPDETLFMDDTLMHLEGASELGIQVEHINADQDIFAVINRLNSKL